MQAVWNQQVIAESDSTVVVEGNHYFPKTAIVEKYFKPSRQTSHCPWKGKASYYDIEVDGKTNAGAAWYYPEPSEQAQHIKDHVAFWKGVEVKE